MQFFRSVPFVRTFLLLCAHFAALNLFANGVGPFFDIPEPDDSPRFNVQSYTVEGKTLPPTNSFAAILAKHTGTNVDLNEIVEAAAALQTECQHLGFPVSVAIAQKHITNGIVSLYLFQGGTPQILVSGRRYLSARERVELAAKEREANPAVPSADKNTGPHFAVNSYLVSGNTLLKPESLKNVLFKHLGTNITVNDILEAGADLQKEYRDRGFPTVGVTIPPQQITNGVVKLRVFEGRLSDIVVAHNHYFSSNNVMRVMPSLRTNMILNAPVFQAELNRANANQDRQIYPKIEPGPTENTTVLSLDVKDRLPLHGKLEFNNQSSPGTPDQRVNASAVYNNLWQAEHSLGVQYSFSPERYKTGDNWNFYDLPMVANYSAFYRLPLAQPESLADVIEAEPGTFGYSEATRKFTLPPASGLPEMNVYASRSVIDTGLMTLSDRVITNIPGALLVSEKDVQEDLTINQDIGTRLTFPIRGTEDFQSSISGGLDYKTYELLSSKTNNFFFSIITVNPNGTTNPPVTSQVASPVPLTHRPLQYLPLALRYDASLHDSLGVTAFGLGTSGNVWYSGSTANLQGVTGSTKSSGRWFVLNPSLSRDLSICTNWILTLRADGQWASEPLISNEQFGAGGVMSVRGYHEGEVFGDTGWHVSLEQKTPPHVVGFVSPNNPLTVRGSIYLDYAQTYLLDPQGRPGETDLWGVGLGGVATIGSHWEAHLLLSFPLLRTGTVAPYEPFFNFALNAQF